MHMDSQCEGTLYGLFIGDALAMPVHWYYNRAALARDYGVVRDYLVPRNPHPDSILWRSSYRSENELGEILHDQAKYWGRKGVHYHQFLQAGENTLNLKLAALLIESLSQKGEYDADDYLKRYIAFMTSPGSHRDTYIEECHRNFFTNFARGVSPRSCGVVEKHIGGLVGVVPIVVFYLNHPPKAKDAALEHLSITHPGSKMKAAASLIIDILLDVLEGKSVREVILGKTNKEESGMFRRPYTEWLKKDDQDVIGRNLSTACYVEDSVPAVLYLALKYEQELERALVVNTNLGGDNAHRGAILGALLGAANGIEAFPKRWIDGLKEHPGKLNPKI